MNKRIQELAEQAGLYIKLYEKPYPKDMSAEECNEAYLKFAELIILECAAIISGAVALREPASTYVSKILEAKQ
jgi:hypothetical protein